MVICFLSNIAGSQTISKEENELKDMLNLLRIKAETHLIHWHSLENYISDQFSSERRDTGCREKSVEDEGHDKCSISSDTHDESTPDKATLYLKSACEMVRKRSSETAVIFLYLPKPPRIQNSTKAESYLTNLEVLTNHWPPTLLVRGVSPVTSTTL